MNLFKNLLIVLGSASKRSNTLSPALQQNKRVHSCRRQIGKSSDTCIYTHNWQIHICIYVLHQEILINRNSSMYRHINFHVVLCCHYIFIIYTQYMFAIYKPYGKTNPLKKRNKEGYTMTF